MGRFLFVVSLLTAALDMTSDHAYGGFLGHNALGDFDLGNTFVINLTVPIPSVAMTMKMVGKGSQYAVAYMGANGNAFDGGKTYKVHLPPNVPAKDF
jgi:hypothetical protein